MSTWQIGGFSIDKCRNCGSKNLGLSLQNIAGKMNGTVTCEACGRIHTVKDDKIVAGGKSCVVSK